MRPRGFPERLLGLLLASVLVIGLLVSARTTGPDRSAAGGGLGETRAESGRPDPGRSVGFGGQQLVPWRGPVEQLFFHPLVIRPGLAFGNDSLGEGFEDFFVTAREFRAILEELWRNGWTLVDARQVAAGRVRVPPGRKPLVLYEDDANYYRYFAGRGLASRLVLEPNGDVRAEYEDRSGQRHLTTEDLVPLVDAAVEKHPEFSAGGAKGVLVLTAYEGLFGEHDLSSPAARARVRALAHRLRATGWSFASHTFGHIDLGNASLATIARDTARWRHLTRDLIGPTDMLVYPYGSHPTELGRRLLLDRGFDIQVDIDIVARRVVQGGLVMMSRRHVDGLAFEHPRRLAPFFAVKRVWDPARPPQ